MFKTKHFICLLCMLQHINVRWNNIIHSSYTKILNLVSLIIDFIIKKSDQHIQFYFYYYYSYYVIQIFLIKY